MQEKRTRDFLAERKIIYLQNREVLFYEFNKRRYFTINDDFLFCHQTILIFYIMKNPYDKQIGGSHYQNFKIQPSKFVIENELLYPEGCVIKYIIRHRLKGKKEDLKKAIHVIEMIIERDYPDV